MLCLDSPGHQSRPASVPDKMLPVKINKQKPHLKWIRRPERWALTPYIDHRAQQVNSIYNSSLNYLLSSIKELPLLCFSGCACGSPLDSMSYITILCCFQINPILLEKYLASIYLRSTLSTFHPGEQNSGQHQTPLNCSVFQIVQKALLSDTLPLRPFSWLESLKRCITLLRKSLSFFFPHSQI